MTMLWVLQIPKLGACYRVRRQGGLAVLTVGFLAFFLSAMIPIIYTVAEMTRHNAQATLAAQNAAYAATSQIAEAQTENGIALNVDAATARANQVLQENIRVGEGILASYEADVNVHNIKGTVTNSIAVDPNCQNLEYCWQDQLVGAYHRTSGVSVAVRVTLRFCSGWSNVIGNASNCPTRTFTEYGYADYTTLQPVDPDAIDFNLQGPPSYTTQAQPQLTWSIEGRDVDPTTVRCYLDVPKNQPRAQNEVSCTRTLSGSWQPEKPLAVGEHNFMMTVGSGQNLRTSELKKWRLSGAPSPISITMDGNYDNLENVLTARWTITSTLDDAKGRGVAIDPGASSCSWQAVGGARTSAEIFVANCMQGGPPYTYSKQMDRDALIDMFDTDQLQAFTMYRLKVYAVDVLGNSAIKSHDIYVGAKRTRSLNVNSNGIKYHANGNAISWSGGWSLNDNSAPAEDIPVGYYCQIINYNGDSATTGVHHTQTISPERCFGAPGTNNVNSAGTRMSVDAAGNAGMSSITAYIPGVRPGTLYEVKFRIESVSAPRLNQAQSVWFIPHQTSIDPKISWNGTTLNPTRHNYTLWIGLNSTIYNSASSVSFTVNRNRGGVVTNYSDKSCSPYSTTTGCAFTLGAAKAAGDIYFGTVTVQLAASGNAPATTIIGTYETKF